MIQSINKTRAIFSSRNVRYFSVSTSTSIPLIYGHQISQVFTHLLSSIKSNYYYLYKLIVILIHPILLSVLN